MSEHCNFRWKKVNSILKVRVNYFQKVRVRVNNIFKVRLIAYSKVRVNKLNRDLKVIVSLKKS